jgi:hypothetical protein
MPRLTPSGIPSYMRRCVVDLVNKGHDLNAAFAICNSTMQKAGYITSGPDQKQTKKGRQRQRHFSAMDDAAEYDAAYERILEKAKKTRAYDAKKRKISQVISSFVEVLAGEIPPAILREMLKRDMDLGIQAERVRANAIVGTVSDLLAEAGHRRVARPADKATRAQLNKTAKKCGESVILLLEEGARLAKVSKEIDAVLADCISI